MIRLRGMNAAGNPGQLDIFEGGRYGEGRISRGALGHGAVTPSTHCPVAIIRSCC
jgi:hypothetical protein